MTALECLNAEIAQRDLHRVKPGSLDQVRRLVIHPEAGQDILHERLLLGCVALDECETDDRWELFELLLTAYRCCQVALDAKRQAIEDAETERIRTDPERQLLKRRLAATNRASLNAYLAREAAPQVVPPETDNRQPQMIRRHSKENTHGTHSWNRHQ